MTKPVRLQLSRTKGFNLQQHSLSINGLPAAAVTRRTKWGNPFVIGSQVIGKHGVTTLDARLAVELYRLLLHRIDTEAETQHFLETFGGKPLPDLTDAFLELSGKNLACACRLCTRHAASGLPMGEQCEACGPCHTHPLLEAANP